MYALLLSRDPDLAGILRATFRAAGLRLVVTEAAHTATVVPPRGAPPDLVVLDCSLNLPDDAARCQRLLSSAVAPALIIHVKGAVLAGAP